MSHYRSTHKGIVLGDKSYHDITEKTLGKPIEGAANKNWYIILYFLSSNAWGFGCIFYSGTVVESRVKQGTWVGLGRISLTLYGGLLSVTQEH
jgi:hypothetical protein